MHVCTVCHPRGKWTPKNAEEHRAPDHSLTGCCFGCGCGWWRNLPDEELPEDLRAQAEKVAAKSSV